ncbi:MAG: hypothetical protein ACTSX0_11455, partial [Promethearchaeota archaeon]
SAPKLSRLGWTDQSKRIAEGVIRYQEKLTEDKKYREKLARQEELTKEELAELEQKALEAKENQQKKERQKAKEKQRQREKNAYQQAIAAQLFAQIDEIEAKIRNYEQTPDKIILESPYTKAIEVYKQASETFRDIEWTEQAIRLSDAISTYKKKMEQDRKYREKENLRQAKTKEEERMFELRAQKAKQLELERLKTLEREKKKEQELKAYQESIANQVFSQIEKIEQEIKEYESLLDKIPFEPPYQRAIEIYFKGAKTLKEINWTKESIQLFEGAQVYSQKLEKDQQFREEEARRKAKSKEEAQLLEQRAKLAEQLKRQREKELEERKKREREEQNFKLAIADQIYAKIEKIEKEVEEYESQPEKILFDPPYEKCIEIYKQGAQQLIDIGWNSEGLKLLEGMHVYQQKYKQDQEFRRNEQLRVAKSLEEQKLLEQRALKAKQIQEARRKQEQERLRKEQEENAYKQEVAKNILSEIAEAEQKVKDYESRVDKIPYICPYEEVIKIYQKSAERIREIGWTSESIRLFDGIKTYQEKLRKDQIYREKEKLRIAKTKEGERLLEERARLSREIQLKHQKEQETIKRRREAEEKEKEQKAKEIFNKIDEIENKVREYESHIERYSFIPPYEEAIKIYLDSAKKLEAIGWRDEGIKLFEGVKTYQERLKKDQEYRRRVEQQKEIQEMNAKALQQQIEKSQEELYQRMQQEANQKAIQNQEMQHQKEISERALTMITEGNNLAQEHKFKEAIIKYLEASKLFQQIGWKQEAEKIANQIEFFKQEEMEYLAELKRQEEERLKRIKEYEELEKKARISWSLKQKEQLEQEKHRKMLEEEKRKRDLEEIQKLISESQQIKSQEELKRQQKLAKEQEKARKAQEIHNQCFQLLDQARAFVKENNFKDALNIYQQVLDLYQQINYEVGIRITQETIKKTQQDMQAYQEQQKLQEIAEQERKEEIERIKELIRKSEKESERRLLEEQKRKLEENEIKNKEEQIQNRIFDLLEMGSNFALQHEYDLAIARYKEALILFDEINWPLKKKQIKQLIEETKVKKQLYAQKVAEIRKRQEEELKKQKDFEKLMAQQELKRKSSLESFEEISLEQKRLASLEQERGEQAYKFLEIGENSLREGNPYLSLYYLHHAMYNFTQNNWTLEVNTTKKRLQQIYSQIPQTLIHLPELLQNTVLDDENIILEEITACINFLDKENIDGALNSYNTIKKQMERLKWQQSLENLTNLHIEILALKSKLEHRAQLPTKEDGFELLNSAKDFVKQAKFEDAKIKNQKALEIFTNLGLSDLRRLCEQNLKRIELSYKKYQNEKFALEKLNEIESPELRKQLRIEIRKKIRRKARKNKIMA